MRSTPTRKSKKVWEDVSRGGVPVELEIRAMLKRPTCVEWFVVLVILVILFSLARDKYDRWQTRRRYENRIVAFDQKMVAPLVLPAERIIVDERLSGRWVTLGHRNSSTLIFKRAEDGCDFQYRVEFTTHTCTGSHNAECTAEYRDGKVFLERPLAEALGPVFQQLYCVRVGSRRVLIPGTISEDTTELLAAIHNAESRNEWRDLQALSYLFKDGEAALRNSP